MSIVINPGAVAAVPGQAVETRPTTFHRSFPGYSPTPLVSLPAVAADHGLSAVRVKNEQSRFGLPAYKVLGGSWSVHEAVRRHLGLPDDVVIPFAELRARAAALGITLTTATDGNHGRGIAFMAQQCGFSCVVFVPQDMVTERADAIASHGARVVRVGGGYDDAVHAALGLGRDDGAWVCADTAGHDSTSPDYHFARDVQEGYHTLFAEMDAQAGRTPDLLVLQAGVGALTASAIDYYARAGATTRVVSVEPVGSACVQASVATGAPATAPDTFSIMAGLRSAQISMAAWPWLRTGVWASVSVDDNEAIAAVRLLAGAGIEAGESGAAGLAGLLQLARDASARTALGLSAESYVALVNTEGATDRDAYARYLAG